MHIIIIFAKCLENYSIFIRKNVIIFNILQIDEIFGNNHIQQTPQNCYIILCKIMVICTNTTHHSFCTIREYSIYTSTYMYVSYIFQVSICYIQYPLNCILLWITGFDNQKFMNWHIKEDLLLNRKKFFIDDS